MLSLQTFIIILCFLVIFGVMLYLILHKLVGMWKDDNMKQKKIALWMWRVTLMLVVAYIIFLLLLNKNPLYSLLMASTQVSVAIFIFLFVFFISLVEITVIDLILPDVVKLWKRILIETLSFVALVLTTVAVFIIYPFAV